MITKEVLMKFMADEGQTSDKAEIQGGKTAIQDSKIGLMLNDERKDIPFREGDSLKFFKYFDGLFKAFSGQEPVFDLPTEKVDIKTSACECCGGVGKVAPCETCEGSGEHECECGDSHECGDCKGDGYIRMSSPRAPGKKTDECQECDNGNVSEDPLIEVGPAKIRGYQIALLQELPQPVKLYIRSKEDLVFFTFPGGQGVLMPIQ